MKCPNCGADKKAADEEIHDLRNLLTVATWELELMKLEAPVSVVKYIVMKWPTRAG